jgi:ABC-2 type transport system ATP-binding protein
MNAPTRPATRTAGSANGVRKAYGDKVVLDSLDSVDLSIREGEAFALLGPNGAGKTTTVRILSTLLPADAGAASVMGHDLRAGAPAVRLRGRGLLRGHRAGRLPVGAVPFRRGGR